MFHVIILLQPCRYHDHTYLITFM